MLKYFTFTPAFDLRMGTAPLNEGETVVETDERYLSEIKLKRSLLEEDHRYYFDSLPESRLAQRDALEIVLNELVRHDPASFSLQKNGPCLNWHNKKLNENFEFEFKSDSAFPIAPLDWVGSQVQEDLIILNPAGEVVAGQLCFPSGWALHEKLGKQFLEVHGPLPEVTNPMIQSANKFLERLPVGKPFTRNNWGFRLGDQLDMSSRYSKMYREKLADELPLLSRESFGEKIFVRIEHQTLTRLPSSNYILFTIHTFHSSLKEEVSDKQRARTMLSFLKGVPKELLDYKIITPFYMQLLEYLVSVEIG